MRWQMRLKTIQDIMRGTPGLKVGSDFSAKGGGSIEIRGERSVGDISQGSPLIILDGMMFFGEFSEINPEDIGQIDVLKDASAAAVYGAKAANGVIIITTKKGEKGKPVVHFKANYGFVTKSAYREVFSPEGYMNYREDFYKSSTYGVNPDNGKYEEYQARDSKGNLIVTPGYYDRWIDYLQVFLLMTGELDQPILIERFMVDVLDLEVLCLKIILTENLLIGMIMHSKLV